MSAANATQALLEAAGERRAYAALIAVVETRERIPTIERRRLHKLARLVSLTPIERRNAVS